MIVFNFKNEVFAGFFYYYLKKNVNQRFVRFIVKLLYSIEVRVFFYNFLCLENKNLIKNKQSFKKFFFIEHMLMFLFCFIAYYLKTDECF